MDYLSSKRGSNLASNHKTVPSTAKKARKRGRLRKNALRQSTHELETSSSNLANPQTGPLPRLKSRSELTNADGETEKVWETRVDSQISDQSLSLPSGHSIDRQSVLVDGKGTVHARWLRVKQDDLEAYIGHLIEVFDSYKGLVPRIRAPKVVNKDLMTTYVLADPHIGMLSWARETGDAYDLDIGRERLLSSVQELMASTPPSKTAVILNLGDWYHIDDSKNETPASHHRLDADGRYGKIIELGIQVMISVIELALTKHESVVVKSLAGNHDVHASVALSHAIAATFKNNPRVTVDTDPDPFFFLR
jgi:hypothetical protein